jgi:ParB family transcriptional regulator, chromosome partitioning protein
MSTHTRGLGRGLGALIPPPVEVTQDGSDRLSMADGVLEVPIADIIPNPRQPRSAMLPEGLAELADSIREHGVIQPIIVTRTQAVNPDYTDASHRNGVGASQPALFQIIAGERRWRAASLAGLSSVPVIIKEATPQQFLELALVENIQRADLNPLEEAEAFRALMADFGLNQGEVAERVGKSRVAIANTIRLLRLPNPVKALLTEGALSEGHARALLALPEDGLIIKAAEHVVARELTVRETEDLVRRLLAAGTDPGLGQREPEADRDPDLLHTRHLEDEFRSALGTKVSLTRGPRGGRLVISFYSEEELQAIYDRIIGS